MTTDTHNVDHAEIGKFDQLASRWWDPNSEFRPLHEINPLRLDWINDQVPIAGKKIIDVGCGGGILAESMAARGASVTGIDMAPTPLQVAKLHLLELPFYLLLMWFLIGRYGGPRRNYAAVKFLLYSLFGGLLMLVAIFFLAVFVVYYAINWKYLASVWPMS